MLSFQIFALAVANFFLSTSASDASLCPTGFSLYDASTDVFLQCLVDESIVNVSSYDIEGSEITFEYTSPTPILGTHSIRLRTRFEDGTVTNACENAPPYTAAGNVGPDYFPLPNANLGEIRLNAIGYEGVGCKGEREFRSTLDFTLI